MPVARQRGGMAFIGFYVPRFYGCYNIIGHARILDDVDHEKLVDVVSHGCDSLVENDGGVERHALGRGRRALDLVAAEPDKRSAKSVPALHSEAVRVHFSLHSRLVCVGCVIRLPPLFAQPVLLQRFLQRSEVNPPYS